MDTFTQFVLGAAVGVGVMGRQQSVVKSALIGGVCGTLPDLDAFIDHGDPVSNMVLHRGETHSFFWQAVAAPFIASLIALVDRSLHLFFRWWILVMLVLATHTGLDLMTIYGTRALLPQIDMPYGIGSIFIIDPLYTLPLLFGLLLTFIRASSRILKWNLIGLVLSTAYLGWTWYAQQEVTRVVQKSPFAQDLSAEQILVVPTPFNSVLWRIVLLRDDRFQEGFYSLADRFVDPDRPLKFKTYSRGQQLDELTTGYRRADQIRKFSRGFYAVSEVDDRIRITDLRMGQEPYYVFSFEFAERQGRGVQEIDAQSVGLRYGDMQIRPYLDWMWVRIQGQPADPPGPQSAN